MRDAQRTLANLDAAHRRAVARLDQAQARRAALIAEQDRVVAAARAEVDDAVAAMAGEVSVELTVHLRDLDVAEVRRWSRDARLRRVHRFGLRRVERSPEGSAPSACGNLTQPPCS